MVIRRVHQKIERSPEQQAELRRARDKFQREKPSLDDLIASGDDDGPFRHRDVMSFLSAIAELRRERERQGLSLADISGRSGLDKAMLPRLENGKILNPTLTTLWRDAEAVGMHEVITVEPRTPAESKAP